MNAFTPRPLERVPPGNVLEGAFRVHLTLKELKNLKLSQGDLVRVSTPEGARGVAVAWLAVSSTNPGNKPIAKVTDLMRTKLGISLNDKIFIEKAEQEVKPLRAIEVSLADPLGPLEGYTSVEELLLWARYALGRKNGILFIDTCLTMRSGP